MTQSPHILFVNRFYYPDTSATAQILADLAEALASRGWRVSVVASRQLYGDAAASLPAREDHGGVAIHRVRTTRFGRAGIAGRAVDYLSFYVSATLAMLRLARSGDLLVTKTDPPLLSVAGLAAARLRGARSITWLQDLYPEVAVELGMKALGGRTGRLLRGLRNWSLRGSRGNIAIGERMRERLIGEGVAPSQLAILSNWSDDETVQPMPREACALRTEWGLADRFVVAYSGNLGRAHEAETMLGAARALRERDDIVFLMIGGGHASTQLARTVAAEGLRNVQFRPYQPRERLGESLAVGDLHWLSLRPEMEGLIVPSKFYGIAAAGRPVLAVTDPDGEVARLVRRFACGAVVMPGDARAMADTILAYAGDRARCDGEGQAARAMIDAHFRRALAFEHADALFRNWAAD